MGLHILHELTGDNQASTLLTQAMMHHVFKQDVGAGRHFTQQLLAVASDEPYADLRVLVQQQGLVPSQTNEQGRIESRIEHVSNLITSKPESFIDIGTGNGRIADGLREHWDMTRQNAFGIDVCNYLADVDITSLMYNQGAIPLPDNCLDLATCFMVLHHVDNMSAVLRQIWRVLKPGGQLIVRETDAKNRSYLVFNHVCEDLFYKVFSEQPGVPLPNYHGSDRYWRDLFTRHNFEISDIANFEANNPFTPVYYVLRKPLYM